MSDLTPSSMFSRAISRASPVDRVMRVERTDALQFDALHPRVESPDIGLRVPPTETIHLADIERFRGLVYASPAPELDFMSISYAGHQNTQPAKALTDLLTPADRIASTLAHLRGIRGL